MKKVLLLIGRVFSLAVNPKIIPYIEAVWTYIYTGYYARSFKSFGSRSLINSFGLVVGLKYVSVGSNSIIGHHVELTAIDRYKGERFAPEIIIGDNTTIRDYAQIAATNSIRIGNGVLFGPNVTVVDNFHGASLRDMADMPPALRPICNRGPVVIEDNVWIGTKASIMPNVRIGRGAIVAANSVVTHDVPAYSVVAGCPARVVKTM